jgi:hypothetical protein
VPAVVAGAGPFEVIGVPLATGGRSALPSGRRPGVFVAPLGADPEEIGVRQHEYGHLAIESSGIVRQRILQYLVRKRAI